MTTPIAVITRLEGSDERQWMEALAAVLPEERLVLFRDMTEAQRQQAEVAVVANPDPADVAALPNLAWIHSLWAGVERLVAELGPSLPIVRLVDPEMSRVMAEAVLAWTLYLHRDMPAYARQQQARVWRPLPYRRPRSLTVGLLGLGALGTAAAGRLMDAGYTVRGWSRSPKELAGAETLSGDAGRAATLAASDVVICLLPLTAATRGLINKDRLALMKPMSSLINFGRGPLVVTSDLIAALDAGHLSYAVLDVFDQEPLPPDSPLWAHPGITVLPHVSAPTDRQTAAAIVAANIRAWRASGRIHAAVDRTRGY
jgi:glyoxylate/hydroxypyruvate reductase A